jgi:arylsulfatase A-like enzyme
MHSEYLRAAGYYCTNNAKQDYQFRAPLSAWDQNGREAHWRQRKNPEQPFFAIFNFGITHESQIWARAQDSLWVDPDLPVEVPPYLPDNAVGQRDVRQMYSNIVQMDHQIGEVLQQLEEDGALENTIIFWCTDHGGPLPRQKRLLYDSGIKVPMIVRYPEQWQAGTTDDQLISFIDFKPTLMSIANIPIPDYVQGRAFIGKQANTPRDYIHAAADRFDERYDMIRAVRNHQFKYLKNYRPQQGYYLPVAYREQMPVMQELLRLRDQDSLNDIQSQWFRPNKAEEELFDCVNDPHEVNNLANDPEYQDILRTLRSECQRWMEEINDLALQDESEMMADWWPDGTQPQTPAPQISVNENNQISLEASLGSIAYQWVAPGDSLTTEWQLYSQPLTTKAEHQLIAIAHRIGYRASEKLVQKF